MAWKASEQASVQISTGLPWPGPLALCILKAQEGTRSYNEERILTPAWYLLLSLARVRLSASYQQETMSRRKLKSPAHQLVVLRMRSSPRVFTLVPFIDSCNTTVCCIFGRAERAQYLSKNFVSYGYFDGQNFNVPPIGSTMMSKWVVALRATRRTRVHTERKYFTQYFRKRRINAQLDFTI